jgi:CheY-like chemotaxis protein
MSPIGMDGTPERKRANQMLTHIFKPALEPLGYKIIRADEIPEPGSITIQVIEQILNSDLVVADLTGNNPNVFYELGIRHFARKPVIHVIDVAQKIPFDLADLRTIPVSLDLDGAAQARVHIATQTEQIEEGRWGKTPLMLFLENQVLNELVRDMKELQARLDHLSRDDKKRLAAAASLSIASAKIEPQEPGQNVGNAAEAAPQSEPTDLGGTAKLQRKILWVDDHPDNNVYERMALETVGVIFTLAHSTREALDHLKQKQFSAIISDMERHGKDTEGLVLLDEIRRGGNSTPFFIYTAGQRVLLLKPEAKKRGAQGLTVKAQELFEMVTKALGIEAALDQGPGSARTHRTPKLPL